jgi:hypothetical protein
MEILFHVVTLFYFFNIESFRFEPSLFIFEFKLKLILK